MTSSAPTNSNTVDSTTDAAAAAAAACAAFVQRLVDDDVRVVAWDFDLTAVDDHTGGRVTLVDDDWSRVFARWTPRFSADFLRTCRAIAEHPAGIQQAIVTFGDAYLNGQSPHGEGRDKRYVGGEPLLRPLLESALSSSLYGAKAAAVSRHMPIFAWHPAAHRRTCPEGQPIADSKSWHLTYTMRALLGTSDETMRKHVLLIDDGAHNISHAKREGYRTHHVTGTRGFAL
jgi:hypothetical protein